MSKLVSPLLAFLFLAAAGCGGAAPSGAASPEKGMPTEAGPSAGAAAASAAPDEKRDPELPAASDAARANAAPPPPPAGAPGKANVDDTTLMGHLSQEQIKDIVMKNGDLFGECYTIGAGKGKSFIAKVTVKATVGPTGTVNAAEVTKSTAKNAKVDACVQESFKKMKFPKPANGQAQVISFPIEFDGVEEVRK